MSVRVSSLFLATCLALPAAAQKHPDVRINTGRPGGAANAASPVLAAGNAAVYAAWVENRNVTSDVFFNRSLDGGALWFASDVRIGHGPLGVASAHDARLVAARTSPNVVVVWIDDRNGGNDVFCNRSLDGGLSWLPADVRLDSSAPPGTGAASEVRLAMSGSSVYAVWTDARGAGTDIYANASHDNGATWLASDLKLNSSNGTASHPDLAAADPFVHVVWNDARNGLGDVYFTRTSNSGSSWLPTDVRLNVGTAAGTVPHVGAPRIALSQQHVYVLWTDGRNTATTGAAADVFFVASHDSGTSWPATDTRLNGFGGNPPPGGAFVPQLAATGSAVFVTWADGRASALHRDIFLNGSADAGATWRGDVRLDVGDAAGASASDNPQIATAGAAVQVAWQDLRDAGTSHVYSNRSANAGVAWLGADVRLDPGTVAGSIGAQQPQIALSGSSVYATWTDDRVTPRGNSDVFFNLANGYQPYGTGTPGQFGGVPILAGSGSMVVGGAGSINVSNGLGGAAGVLAIGYGPGSQVSVPLVGGTLLVAPATALFLTLGGPTGVPGTGTRNTALPVPANTALLGLDVNFQGLFLDAGAVQGVSMSNAIAAWIG